MRTLFLAICLTLTASVFSADTVNPDEHKIYKVYTDSRTASYCATAFYVGEHELLTAAHTFFYTERYGLKNHRMLMGGKEVPVTVLKIDYEKDICVLHCDVPSSYYILADNYKEGEKALIAGFPNRNKKLTYYEYLEYNYGKFLTVSGEVPEGTSGGPVFSLKKTVIGMVDNGDEYHTNNIPAKALKEFIKDVVKN